MKSKTLLAILCVALSGALASAQTIYSNVSASYPPAAPVLPGAYIVSSTFIGTTFTTTGSGNLSTLLFDASSNLGPTSLTVGLYANSGGQPGSLIESWIATIPGYPGSGISPAATILNSVLQPLLSAATKYWLVFTQTTGSQIIWHANDTGVTGGVWGGSSINSLVNSVPTNSAPGIRLTAGPTGSVPDGGATWTLLLLALGSLLSLRAFSCSRGGIGRRNWGQS